MTGQNRKAIILLVAGFVIWSGAFVSLYALQALGCAYDWPYHRQVMIAAYVGTLIPLGYLALIRPFGPNEPANALSTSAMWANRAAFVSGALVFLPVLFATICI